MKQFRIDKTANKKLCKELTKEIPSDFIIFKSREEADDFHELIRIDDGSEEDCLPADIIIAGTIPLYDCKIIVKDMFTEGVKDLEFRVVIDKKCDKIIERQAGNFNFCTVGCIILKVAEEMSVIFPVCVPKGKSALSLFCTYGYHIEDNFTNYDIADQQDLSDEAYNNYNEIARNYAMPLWYKVQIALLHPIIKNVIAIDGINATKNINHKRKKYHKNVLKYVKRRVINLSEIGFARESKQYKRKTLAWYVIGHYREYKDGKRVFIKPYWKGEMRELKKAVEQRERRIITEGINND